MINRITTYALYGDQIQEDGTALPFTSEGQVSPYVKYSRVIENWELQLAHKSGKVHKITTWCPISSRLHFSPIAFFKNLFNKKAS